MALDRRQPRSASQEGPRRALKFSHNPSPIPERTLVMRTRLRVPRFRAVILLGPNFAKHVHSESM